MLCYELLDDWWCKLLELREYESLMGWIIVSIWVLFGLIMKFWPGLLLNDSNIYSSLYLITGFLMIFSWDFILNILILNLISI